MKDTMDRRVFVSVASNIQPATHVPRGLDLLDEVVHVAAVSPFYVTEPIGRPEQDVYWNGVAQVLPGDGLWKAGPVAFRRDVLRPIEAACGRVRTEDAYAARTLDLDLLLWGDAVVEEDGLRLPDPDILERPFLARALLDLDQDLELPGIGGLAGLVGPDVGRQLVRAPFHRDPPSPDA